MTSTSTVQTVSWSAKIVWLDTAIRLVLLVYIASLPFKPLLVVERNGFLVLLVLLLLWCLGNRKLFFVKTPHDKALFAFALWVGITIPFATFPEYSLKEYGKLLQWVVVFYAVLYFLGGRPYREILLGALAGGAALITLYGLTQFNLTNPQSIVSFFPAEVWLTTFLVIAIPFALVAALGPVPPMVRGAGGVLLLLSIFCLISTQSRAGLVALSAELLAIAWILGSRRAKLVTGLILVCLLGAVALAYWDKQSRNPSAVEQPSIPVRTGTETMVHRLDIWKFTFSEIAKHWLVGIGYGGQTYLRIYGPEGEMVEPGHASVKDRGTHNILLYLSLHVGVVGAALFLWFYGRAMWVTLLEYRRAIEWKSQLVLAGMVGSMIGLFVRLQLDQMFVGSLAILFWVLLATSVLHYPPVSPAVINRVAE